MLAENSAEQGGGRRNPDGFRGRARRRIVLCVGEIAVLKKSVNAVNDKLVLVGKRNVCFCLITLKQYKFAAGFNISEQIQVCFLQGISINKHIFV